MAGAGNGGESGDKVGGNGPYAGQHDLQAMSGPGFPASEMEAVWRAMSSNLAALTVENRL